MLVAHLLEVDIHAGLLDVRSTSVNAVAVDAMLARDGLPEGSTNLVTLIRS